MNAAKPDSEGPVEGKIFFQTFYHYGVKFINTWYCKSD